MLSKIFGPKWQIGDKVKSKSKKWPSKNYRKGIIIQILPDNCIRVKLFHKIKNYAGTRSIFFLILNQKN